MSVPAQKLRALTSPLVPKMDEREEDSLLDIIEAHETLVTIRKCVCDTLRGHEPRNEKGVELRMLLDAEAMAVVRLEKLLFPKGVRSK